MMTFLQKATIFPLAGRPQRRCPPSPLLTQMTHYAYHYNFSIGFLWNFFRKSKCFFVASGNAPTPENLSHPLENEIHCPWIARLQSYNFVFFNLCEFKPSSKMVYEVITSFKITSLLTFLHHCLQSFPWSFVFLYPRLWKSYRSWSRSGLLN